MTYEEREKELCRECNRKETCPYIPRKMEYKCQHLSDMMYGWELGHKDATDKACEFFNENMWEFTFQSDDVYVVDGHATSISEFIRNFKDYMEEQQ